ncbi:MAG: TonB-dependent receptor [Bacteroidota bacterium]
MRSILIIKPIQKKKLLFLLLCFLACSAGVIAQKTISGTIKDETGAALAGVSIVVKNDTLIGTVTNASGNFSLVVPAGRNMLTVSYVGYQTQDVTVANQASVNVVLAADKLNLNEVVITGYTAQQKKDITGSVAIVDMKSLKSLPAGSAMQALQGQAAGVNVINSGVPGAASMILIRGVSSFGDNQPLILVDGVQSDLNTVSADDIESMQVLKDAGAASIYGVRGSNGVIVVTTKKGKTGAPTVSYHGYVNFEQPQSGNALNLMNSTEYEGVYNVAHPVNQLFANGIPDYTYGGAGGRGVAMEGDAAVDPSKYVLDLQNPINNYLIQRTNKTGTDWYHEFFKPAVTNSHTLSASGGSEKANYMFSMGYIDQQGVAIQSFSKRYTGRINTQFKLPGNIRIGENVSLIYGKATGFYNPSGDFGTIWELYQMMPIIPVYDIQGNFASTFAGPSEMGNAVNPVALQKGMDNDQHNTWNITGNAYAEVDLFKHFTARTSYGGTILHAYDQVFSPNQYFAPNQYLIPNGYSESAGYSSSSTWTNSLAYSNQFGKHNVKVIGGSEAIRNYGRNVGGSAQTFFATNPEYLVLNNGTTNITNFSNAFTNTLFSLFGRLDYSYNNKYIAGITVRRDGSSRFGSKKRYGTFPSYSVGWRVSEEEFIKNVSWINDLKIRASYGKLGSQNNISASNPFTLFANALSGSYYDLGGTGNSVRQGFYQSSIGNPFTGWEEDVISNAGFDATIFNRFSLSFDVYKKSINGLLFPQPLPATTGGAAAPYINIGDIQNKGFDITAKYFGNISRDLKLNVSANITTYNNKVKKIPDPGYFDAKSQQQLGNLVRNQEGQSVSAFYGYRVIGLFNSDDDVTKSPTQTDAAPGRFKYADIDGDGAITPDDRTFLGSPNPDFTYGVNLGFEYKGFDFSAFFYGSQGSEIINTLKVNSHFFSVYVSNKSRDLLNAWTPDNTNTGIPKIETQTSFSTNGVMNSFFIENGSYLKLKSLILGYTIKPGILKRVGISRLRPYLQATNLFTSTKYSGLDPELTGPSSAFGIDWGNYPPSFRTYVFGIDLSF